MGEVAIDVLMIASIVTLACLLGFLVWVAATSKTFVAVSLTALVSAWVALLLLIAVLVAFDRLIWWAALGAVLAGSTPAFLALPALAKVGLRRTEAQLTQLKTESPDHWSEGQISGRASAERLAALPRSSKEEKRVHGQLASAAEAAHLKLQPHERPGDGCEALLVAFTEAFLESLRSREHEIRTQGKGDAHNSGQ